MSDLKITEIVLYKHGLAYYVRRGVVEGTQTSLVFQKEQIEAILKSLTVVDYEGGTVKGVRFLSENPMGSASIPQIDLSNDGSLRDLFRDLRGQTVSISYQIGDKPRSLVGRIIGLETATRDSDKLLVLGIDGQVKVLSLSEISGFRIPSSKSSSDLSNVLDTSMLRETQREFVIEVSEGKHDLEVSYTMPAPGWRVSYRVIAESNQESQSGELLLQGWAIIDNGLDEAWDQVTLKLVAGKPLKAASQLYSETPLALSPKTMMGSSGRGGDDEFIEESADMRFQAAPAPIAQSFARSVSTTKDLGELFEYAISTPVSVQRSGSALVPLLSTNISYQRELVLDLRKRQSHPVAAIRFTNLSGYTLDKGPVVIIENGVYKGEATIEYSKPNSAVSLPYAEEQGIRYSTYPKNEEVITKVTLRNTQQRFLEADVAIAQVYNIRRETVTIDNNTDTDRVLVIEQTPKAAYQDYFEMETPDELTSEVARWKINLPKRATTTWVLQTRTATSKVWQVNDLATSSLNHFRKLDLMDQKTYEKLTEIIKMRQAIANLRERLEKAKDQHVGMSAQNEEWRKTMSVLTGGASDDSFRTRLLTQLQQNDERAATLVAEQEKLVIQIDAGEQKLRDLIEKLAQ